MEKVNATAIGIVNFFTPNLDSIGSSAQVRPRLQRNATDAGLPAQSLPVPRSCAGSQTAVRGLANVARDEFRHLEHADLALPVENCAERVVGIDLSSLCLVL